ncbi:MAG TPA: response regulator, partial [Gammaproteobacteria bacterium]
MNVRFFIIDDNAKFRLKLTQLLKSDWPGAKVEQFEPAVQGWPGEDVDWSGYDLLFMDYFLHNDNGLEWYEVLKHKPHFPPTVIMSAQPDPELAVQVIKAGAENYLPKAQATREKLKEVVQEMLRRHNRAGTEPDPAVKSGNTGSNVRITLAPTLAEAEKAQLKAAALSANDGTPSAAGQE